MGHFDFSLFLVNLGIMTLEPVVAEDQALLPESGDSQEHPLGVSLVPENYIHNLGNPSCLVGRAVDVEDWDVAQ